MRQLHSRPGPHTWKEFLALPDDDRRELVDGRFVEIEMPKAVHEWIVMYLGMTMGPWCLAHGSMILGSGYKVRVSRKNGAMPDVQVLDLEDYDPASDGLEQGRPRLAVEVISPSSRAHDRLTKMAWYARIGVPEYWIIDVDARRLERYVLRDTVYSCEQTACGDEVFRPSSFKGLKIPLAPMWTKALRRKAGARRARGSRS